MTSIRSGMSSRSLIAATLCSVIEWYDFIVFGLLVTYIASAHFPGQSSSVALSATLAIFGVGILSRPLGGVVIGWISDRYGRRKALLLTMASMAVGTVAIGLIPSYEAIGLIAPLALLLCRFVQGFSAGGEWGVAIAYLAEWSSDRRGFWGSFLAVTVAVGSLLASGLVALLSFTLSPEQMAVWGWRLPFFVGGVLGLLGLQFRLRLSETPVFRQQREDVRPESGTHQLKMGLFAFGLTIHWTVSYYVFFVYMPTFVQAQTDFGLQAATWSNTISLLAIALLVPVMGSMSDRIGRRPLLLASCGLGMVGAIPAFLLMAGAESFAQIVGIQLCLALINALYSGPGPAALAELFPTRNRSQLSALCYGLAAAIFGGFAPFISDLLVRITASPTAPAAYVIVASGISLLTVLCMNETAHDTLA